MKHNADARNAGAGLAQTLLPVKPSQTRHMENEAHSNVRVSLTSTQLFMPAAAA